MAVVSIFLEDLITFHWQHQMAICWLKISTLRYPATFPILSWNNFLDESKNLLCSSFPSQKSDFGRLFQNRVIYDSEGDWLESEKLPKISGGVLVSEIYPNLSNVFFSVKSPSTDSQEWFLNLGESAKWQEKERFLYEKLTQVDCK